MPSACSVCFKSFEPGNSGVTTCPEHAAPAQEAPAPDEGIAESPIVTEAPAEATLETPVETPTEETSEAPSLDASTEASAEAPAEATESGN